MSEGSCDKVGAQFAAKGAAIRDQIWHQFRIELDILALWVVKRALEVYTG